MAEYWPIKSDIDD